MFLTDHIREGKGGSVSHSSALSQSAILQAQLQDHGHVVT